MITFKAALEAYNTQTQKDIASHPLVFQLSCCGSPSAILDVLRAQVQVFNQSHRDEKLTTWLAPTVNVLHAFSATLGNVVGLVSFDSLKLETYALTCIFQVFPPANAIFAGIGVLLQVSIFLTLAYRVFWLVITQHIIPRRPSMMPTRAKTHLSNYLDASNTFLSGSRLTWRFDRPLL